MAASPPAADHPAPWQRLGHRSYDTRVRRRRRALIGVTTITVGSQTEYSISADAAFAVHGPKDARSLFSASSSAPFPRRVRYNRMTSLHGPSLVPRRVRRRRGTGSKGDVKAPDDGRDGLCRPKLSGPPTTAEHRGDTPRRSARRHGAWFGGERHNSIVEHDDVAPSSSSNARKSNPT